MLKRYNMGHTGDYWRAINTTESFLHAKRYLQGFLLAKMQAMVRMGSTHFRAMLTSTIFEYRGGKGRSHICDPNSVKSPPIPTASIIFKKKCQERRIYHE